MFAWLLVLGCASTRPITVYLPSDSDQVRAFYRNGHAIAAAQRDSTFALVELEPAQVGQTIYMRLWLLYEHHGQTPILLEPLKSVTLHSEKIGKAKSAEELMPTSPTRILAKIKNEEAVSSILQGIGGTLQALAVESTAATTTSTTSGTVSTPRGDILAKTSSTNFSTSTLNDAPDKAKEVLRRTSAEIAQTHAWYDAFRHSVSAGILRKNTLFHDEGVNGYIYFVVDTGDYFESYACRRDYRYTVDINTPHGSITIRFDPTEGE